MQLLKQIGNRAMPISTAAAQATHHLCCFLVNIMMVYIFRNCKCNRQGYSLNQEYLISVFIYFKIMGSCFSQEDISSKNLQPGYTKEGDRDRHGTKDIKPEEGRIVASKQNEKDNNLRSKNQQVKPESYEQKMGNHIGQSSKEVNKNTIQDDVLIRLVQKQLQMLGPTYEQLLEIVGYAQAVKFSNSPSILQEQTELATDLLRKNPGKNMHSFFQNLQIKDPINPNHIRSRLFYGLWNVARSDNKFKNWEKKPKQLKPEEINELTSYEDIQLEIEKFTESFYLKLLEIIKNTEQMGLLFSQCFSQNKQILADSEFFTLFNGFKAASFSRQGCSSDKRGIYIFLNYLVRTIKVLEDKKIPLGLIEELVKLLIENLSKMYPPGQDLVGGDENLQKTLKEIGVTWNKELDPLQNNPLINFNNETNKREVLQQQILKRAKIASQELPYLNQIIRENCLKKCIGVDSNLKLYAQTKNQKALVRIIQKILFKDEKKEESQNLPKSMDDSEKDALQKKFFETVKEKLGKVGKSQNQNDKIEDHLKEEQKKYQNQVENRLKDKKQLEFTISDMVRGKCTFSRIQDIIETIENIRKHVEQEQKKDPKKFRILEIESRFTKPIPISDITLKIALHQRIIAQLQLTLQNNVATYAFAHKIYEFQRSKAFSKIKTVFNYYEEYKKQFQELTIGQIQLSKVQTTKQSQKISTVAKDVAAYFEISEANERVTLINVLNDQKYQIKGLNQQQKVLVKSVFERKMKKTNDQRAPLFSKYLKREQPNSQLNIFKSILFYQMIKDIDISENYNEICKQYDNLTQYLKKQFFGTDEKWPLETIYQPTIRTQIKYQELQELFKMVKQRSYTQYYESILYKIYGNNQEMCEWLIRKGKMYNYKDKHSQAIKEYDNALKVITGKKQKQLITKIKLSKAITLIKDNCFKEAIQILQEIEPQYKEAKQYKSATICIILLSQCALSEGDNIKFRTFYDGAKEIVKLHKINFGGAEIADSQYRIGQHMLKMNQNHQDGLDIHFRHAFEEYGEFMHTRQLLEKMKENWGKYKDTEIQEPTLKVNKKVKQVYFAYKKIDPIGCLYLSKAQWPNLQKIHIRSGNIGAAGCQHLSKAQWPRLLELDLYDSSIGVAGCQHLSKAQWPNLQQINLVSNRIGADGCSHLNKAQWSDLKTIHINFNSIGADGCQHLSKAQWPKLQTIDLRQNNIGADGCSHLSKAQWPNLRTIRLYLNFIGTDGCSHLSKAQWPNLQMIDLRQNNIGADGCSHLSKAQWSNLQKIQLDKNKIGADGCSHLTKAQWHNIQFMGLRSNKIPRDQLERLSQLLRTAFPNATDIQL